VALVRRLLLLLGALVGGFAYVWVTAVGSLGRVKRRKRRRREIARAAGFRASRARRVPAATRAPRGK
jgi:hypothetical protein